MTGEAFWSLSHYELGLQFRGARQRQDRLYELAIYHAWHVAAFTRAKELPALGPVLQRMRRSSSSQPQQANLITALHAIGDLYGLKVRVRRAEKAG